MCAIFAIISLLLLISTGALAGEEAASDELADFGSVRPKAPLVQLAPVPLVVIGPGKSSTVKLDFRVPAGFHINSNQPRGDLLVATTVKLDAPTNLAIGKISYPAGQDMRFDFTPEELNVYTGDFRVTALVRAAQSIPPGTFRVHGTLKYQACNVRACFPPTKLPVQFDVKVKESSRRKVLRNTRQSPHIH